MSLDLMLIVGAVVVGLGYFTTRSRRKQRQIGDQARRAAN